jgi:small subunit ribosomal protein S14
MANKGAIAKNKIQKRLLKQGSNKFKEVRLRNRCQICGRPRGYIGRFKMCRICFRLRAINGELPGVKKMSW